MRTPTDRPSCYRALICGTLNGTTVLVEGAGRLDHVHGVAEGQYTFREAPKEADKVIFTAVALTGYPSVCKAKDTHPNPFHGGQYRYNRLVDFGHWGCITYQADCIEQWQHGRLELLSRFVVEGCIRTPRLDGNTSLVESWTPRADRFLNGFFEIAWNTEAGGLLKATAWSKYDLLASRHASIRSAYRRQIVINSCVDANGELSVHQCAELWHEPKA